MNTFRFLIPFTIVTLFAIPFSSFAQGTTETMAWLAGPTKYEGTYHFGDSEWESTFVLIYDDGKWVAQIRSGEWNKDATDWVRNFTNLTDVSVGEGGHFYSKEYQGKFVKEEIPGGKTKKGLYIAKCWSGGTEKDGSEIGWKNRELISKYFAGEYTEASTTVLKEDEIKHIPGDVLKLMRNEIFARYGYRFKKGGAMDTYFSKQDWYRAQHSDVNDFLTAIEKANIKTIQALEAKK